MTAVAKQAGKIRRTYKKEESLGSERVIEEVGVLLPLGETRGDLRKDMYNLMVVGLTECGVQRGPFDSTVSKIQLKIE